MEKKIITVKPDEITNIEVSGAFLSDLNNMLLHKVMSMEPEESMVLMKEIQSYIEDGVKMSPEAADLFTLVTLINTIETSFRLQGKTKQEKIDKDGKE